jgi:hypothetical protein
MQKQLLSALATYGRTAGSAVLGAYLAGQTQPKLLLSLAASSIAAPLFRALNPNDASFGVKKSS